MTIGYVIGLNTSATACLCPLCGLMVATPVGPVIIQLPSTDVVCDECAATQLDALHVEACVLRHDTPIDYPGLWPAIADLLVQDRERDPVLGHLLELVGLQRYTGPAREGHTP